jgi:hypothetical protein
MTARQDGMEQSAAHAGLEWRGQALEALHAFSLENTGFLIEAVRVFADKRGVTLPEGCHPSAWGAVTLEAVSLGFIERESYSAVGTNNGSPKPIWRSKILKERCV